MICLYPNDKLEVESEIIDANDVNPEVSVRVLLTDPKAMVSRQEIDPLTHTETFKSASCRAASLYIAPVSDMRRNASMHNDTAQMTPHRLAKAYPASPVPVSGFKLLRRHLGLPALLRLSNRLNGLAIIRLKR